VAFDARDLLLWNCIENGDGPALEALLATGIALIYHFEDGWSPLHHAVDVESDAHSQVGKPRDLRVIAPLLAHGVEVNALRYRGETASPTTPLDLAETYGNDVAAHAIRRAGGRSGSGVPGRVLYRGLEPGDPRAAPSEGSRITWTRPALAAALAHAGVPDAAYNLWGEERDGAYCVGAVSDGWGVWFCRDGQRINTQRFSTDTEAFAHLLTTLVDDA
jgi:hypothetical protein